MPTVIQNRWDGGHADDIREPSLSKCEESLNFDIFKEPQRLSPRLDTTAETLGGGLVMDTVKVTDVVVATVSSVNKIVGVGGANAKVSFYSKVTLGDSLVLNAETNSGSFTCNYEPGSAITYKGKAYAVGYDGSTTFRLIELTNASTVTTIGTISYTKSGLEKVVTFVHPDDNFLYIIIGDKISVYTGSALTTASSIALPNGFYGTSTTNYGGYLAIVAQPFVGNAKPICFLWGRDTTVTTFQNSIDLGEGFCGVVANLDNVLIFIMSPYNDFSSSFENKIIAKTYSGGAVETVKEVAITVYENKIRNIKAKKGNKVYFVTENGNCVWVFGKNKENQYAITKDHYIINGASNTDTTVTAITSISFVGDCLWAGVTKDSVYSLQKTADFASSAYTSTSSYKTLINPSMALSDRGRDKQLMAIQIMVTGASSGATGVKVSVDGSTFTSAISETNATGEHVYEATMQADGTTFLSGREFQFKLETTGGAKIKEYKYRYENLNSQT